ncbi:uncharacterized protein EDB93DRAFT_784782 [Suillus bovinus]|uniref:uncharacterized protein n=1 Tax=Suillus bovinus TaxID=48563 RepID=UPI001B87C4DC|nr:uncharacterized protein EDB93DRAFT_784782 [Suillus bovinus]KAG2136346.1 hypothetical protein EDB93DRAFT_784782 [Suillus bovinus]
MDDYVVLMERETTIAYVEAASTAALLFDYCLTFDSEVRWTWGRKWGIVRIAFVISRYVPIATCIMYLYYMLESPRGRIPDPGRYIAINGTMSTFNAAAADVMLLARAQAFCGWGIKVLFATVLLSTAIIAVALTFIYVVTSKPSDAYGNFEGEKYLSIAYGLLMVYQLVLMSLILHKRFKFYRRESTPLVTNVYRDGVIYVLCIALASMVNCIGIAVLPQPYTFLFYSPQAVVHSVLSSRILFNLRETSEWWDDVEISFGTIFSRPIRFPSSVDHVELDIIDTAYL